MSLRRTLNSSYKSLEEILIQLDKIKTRTEILRKKTRIVETTGIGIGLAGIAGDVLVNKSFTFSWISIMGTFTGVSIYLVCKEILKENARKERRKLDRIIEGFDEDFAGFREIAQYLMNTFLKDASNEDREVFKKYILNIHFAHERLLEIRNDMKITERSLTSETAENFVVLKENFGNLYNSYMRNFDS